MPSRPVSVGLTSLLLAAGILSRAEERPSPSLRPVVLNGQYGYVDIVGRVAILPQFSWASEFSEGLATISLCAAGGYIDQKGLIRIAPHFERAGPFREGLAPVSVGQGVGFIDRRGQMAIQARFDDALEFSEGLAPVKVGALWGYIDASGRIAIAPRFSSAAPFSDGRARVTTRENDEGFIDRQGTLVMPNVASVFDFRQGMIPVVGTNSVHYLDRNGNEVLKTSFDDALGFSDGLGAVKKGLKWGFINGTGDVIVEPQFDGTLAFSEGRAAIQLEQKWGYIDTHGKVVVRPQYEWVSDFFEGLAMVGISADEWAYIDVAGNRVWHAPNSELPSHRPLMPESGSQSCH